MNSATEQADRAGEYDAWYQTPRGRIEGETIVQFHGIEPWVINCVNPADDPRNAKK